MPGWTPRLVAFAGLVALLGRLPAVGSVAQAFLVGVAACTAVLAVAYGPAALRAVPRLVRRRRLTLPHRPLGPLTLRFHPAHGDDA